MFKSILSLGLLASLLPFVSAMPTEDIEARSESCASVHIIYARGTNETAKDTRLHSVVTPLLKKIKGSNAENLGYPAAANDTFSYMTSSEKGVVDLRKQIEDYSNKCGANKKIVLLGYSQGAQVIFDTLVGTDETFYGTPYPATPALPSKYRGNIAAVACFGDPTHVESSTVNYEKGKGTNPGIFARGNAADIDSMYKGKVVSYCSYEDEVCDSGDSLPAHLKEVSAHGQAAINFILNKVK